MFWCVLSCVGLFVRNKNITCFGSFTKVLIERPNYIQPILMTSQADIFAKYCLITTDRC